MQNQVVVIDDDRASVTVLSVVLRTEGYEVVTAHDGAAGLVAIRASRPMLILLDVDMPVMRGDEVLRELRAEGNRTPIVLMTGTPNPDRFLQEGATVVIHKPFLVEDLRSAIVLALASA